MGAGRPPGHSKFGEPTKPMRIPERMIPQILNYISAKGYKLPLYSSKICAGFPSPADDFIEGELDLNELLIKHPTATFFVRATGESMINAGIYPNDILLVDRSILPTNGKIVVAAVDGELTVKRSKKTPDGNLYLTFLHYLT